MSPMNTIYTFLGQFLLPFKPVDTLPTWPLIIYEDTRLDNGNIKLTVWCPQNHTVNALSKSGCAAKRIEHIAGYKQVLEFDVHNYKMIEEWLEKNKAEEIGKFCAVSQYLDD
jgi:hypothetical protein